MSKLISAIIVSCDIVGHGFETKHWRQVEVIEGLNREILRALQTAELDSVIWASGGDGGHVAFLEDQYLPAAIELTRALRDWAIDVSIPLRVSVHYGRVSTIHGADGRVQMVGDGINLAGSLINIGSPRRIVVTSAFRNYFNEAAKRDLGLPELVFDDEHTIYLKHFRATALCLMRFPDDPEQYWDFERSDHRQLREARRVGNLWQAIYYMKRLFQVDTADPQAQLALKEIQPKNLTVGNPPVTHPLFGVLPRPAVARLLRTCELMERVDGDVICERDDAGDSMFIILKGSIGVVTKPTPEAKIQEAPYDIRINEGGVVGELALALNRPRTATLQAVGDTALLALQYDSLNELLQREGLSSRLATSFEHFIEDRILEHLCRHCPYMALEFMESNADTEPWERLLDGANRIVLPADDATRLSFSTISATASNGLIILASGSVVEYSESRNVPKHLSGHNFDILFARMPGYVVSTDQTYKIDRRSPKANLTIIRISEKALIDYAQDQFSDLVQRIRKRLASQMVFDAFISYSGENADLAAQWKKYMENAGLRTMALT